MWWWFLGCGVSQNVEKKEVREELMEDTSLEDALSAEQSPEKMNEAPQIEYFRFTKAKYITGDSIAVEFHGVDPEHSPIQSDIIWKVNESTLLREKNVELQSHKASKGDVVQCFLTLSDGEKQSQKVIQMRVENSHPTWKKDPREFKDIHGHIVEAEDPDGDELHYMLEGGPKGMTINQKGRIEYRPSIYEPGGVYQVSVIAEDPDGALVRWDFGITVEPGKK